MDLSTYRELLQDSRAWRDLIIILVVSATLIVCIHAFDAFNMLCSVIERNRYDLFHEITASIFVLSIGISVFFIRRWNDYALEITRRKIVEESLRTSEELFELFMQNLPGVSFMKDCDGYYIFANEKWDKLLAKKAGVRWRHLTAEEIWGEEQARRFEAVDRAILVSKTPYESISTHSFDDGQQRLLIRKFPILNREGEPILVGGIGIDVTEQMEIEDSLRGSEARFRALADASFEGIAYSEDGVLVDVNEQMAAMFDYSRDEMIGMPILKLIAPQSRELVSKKIQSMSATIYEHIAQKKYGKVFPIEVRVKYAEVGGRKLRLSIVRDITERKRNEEELIGYQEQLSSLAIELCRAEVRESRRIATDLHDGIGQYLAFAKIKLNELRGDDLSRQKSRIVEEIQSSLQKAIDDVRSLTSELSPPVLYEVGFEPAVEWLAEKIQYEHGVRVDVKVDGDSKPLVEDVRGTLYNIVRELLINIVKHAAAKEVKILIERRDKRIRVVVADDGAGMDVDKVLTAKVKNIGYGLFNIRQRIKSLGGEFTLESTVGNGAVVTLSVPVK